MIIDATDKSFRALNEEIKASDDLEITVLNCLGQRYIGTGAPGKTIHINGIPGNGLGSYLMSTQIIVEKNAQDAVGDTMNSGEIIVNGNIGDTAGYGMRGGRILVKGNAGCRLGIHMKEYEDSVPTIIVGGHCGSFLGEYMAGGTIIVLGASLNKDEKIAGNYIATGIHGGRIYLRAGETSFEAPENAVMTKVGCDTDQSLKDNVISFAEAFGLDPTEYLSSEYCLIQPSSKNPYSGLYCFH